MNWKDRAVLEMLTDGIISVDETGRIWRNWDGHLGQGWLFKPREIKPRLRILRMRPNNTYLQCWFFLNGRTVPVYLHRLVWMAFHGEIPDGFEINHKDTNKLNCRPENLELVTHAENQKHASQHGLFRPARGEQHYRSRLTGADVLQIRSLYEERCLTQRTIAKQFDVSYPTICDIVNRRTWKNVAATQ